MPASWKTILIQCENLSLLLFALNISTLKRWAWFLKACFSLWKMLGCKSYAIFGTIREFLYYKNWVKKIFWPANPLKLHFFHANLCACMIFIKHLKEMMIFVARVYWWFSLSMSYYECEILATTSILFEAGLCRNILTVPMAHDDAFQVLIKKKNMLSNVRLLSHHICNGQKLLANNK